MSAWVLNSGATDHIIGNKDSLIAYSTCNILGVILTNSSIVEVLGIGFAYPHSNLPLTFILHIPKFPFSLAFVSKLTQSL